MGFSRKTIKGTTPLDIKNLNDNLSYLWKKVFGGIGYDDLQSGSIGKKHLRPDLSKGIDDISDRAKYTEELAKQINIQLENTINDVEYYKQENDKKVSELENDLNTTINNVDNIINDLDILNTDYGTFKIDTGTMLASKVSNEDFNSYKIQTADLIASKVDSSTYNSFVTQTNSAIASKVSSQDFNSYVLQTDKNIGSKVSSVEFETYKTQTAQLIASKVSSSDFATYRTQTDKWIADIIVENGEIKSSITQNADNISILADKLVNINGSFFTSDGSIYTGKVYADNVIGGVIKGATSSYTFAQIAEGDTGGVMQIYDIYGNVNVAIGTESGNADNRAGTIVLFDDGDGSPRYSRVEMGVSNKFDAGMINLRDFYGVARVGLYANNNGNTGTIMILDSNERPVTYLTETKGIINNNTIITTANISNYVPDTSDFATIDYVDNNFATNYSPYITGYPEFDGNGYVDFNMDIYAYGTTSLEGEAYYGGYEIATMRDIKDFKTGSEVLDYIENYSIRNFSSSYELWIEQTSTNVAIRRSDGKTVLSIGLGSNPRLYIDDKLVASA